MSFEYRITKYDPRFRDTVGRYTRDEWTFFAQVGQRVAGRPVTISEYLKTEASYLRILSALLTEAGVARLDIRDLNIVPKHRRTLGAWRRRKTVPLSLALEFSRLALRERLWGRLVAPRRAYVHFGWDYYMYVGLSRPTPKALEMASGVGLFIEPFRSPYNRARSNPSLNPTGRQRGSSLRSSARRPAG